MATLEEFKVQAAAEIEADKPLKLIHNGVERELTDEEYADFIEKRALSYWDNQQYSYVEARQAAYGSIGDQLDMMYKDLVDGTTTWKDHIAQVKTDNPKPA